MKKKTKKRVVLNGRLKTEVFVFNDDVGEIVFRGDFVYQNFKLNNIPVLRLTLDRRHGYIRVYDEYTTLMPCLKSNELFRAEVVTLLREIFYNSKSSVICSGISYYIETLKSFSNAKSIVEQIKKTVSRSESPLVLDEITAREILNLIGERPLTDLLIFEKKGGE